MAVGGLDSTRSRAISGPVSKDISSKDIYGGIGNAKSKDMWRYPEFESKIHKIGAIHKRSASTFN